MANEAGALVRVAGMFSQRGFNIETLNVAPTEDPTMSRLTLVTDGTEGVVEQINRQLLKLVDVIDVLDMTGDAHLERELSLVKLRAHGDAEEVERIVQAHGAEVMGFEEAVHTLQFVGTGERFQAFIQALSAAGRLEELVRSGAVAITPGAQGLRYEHDDNDVDTASF